MVIYTKRVMRKMSDLEININNLREKLNNMMKNREHENYSDILKLSVQLDKLINRFYLNDKKISTYLNRC